MITLKHFGRNMGTVDYRAERPLMTAPKIVREIKDRKGIVTHYMCEGKRLFVKTVYDFNFLPAVAVEMKGKFHKSKSIDARVID